MLRSLVVGGLAMLSLAMGGTAQAQSTCDAGITKAIARKVSCKLRVYAVAQRTGSAADAAKLTKCEEKFAASCARAQSKNDCQAQASSCAAIEARADAAVDDLRGTPPPSTATPTATATATATLDPSRPCGTDPGGTCGGSCERGECGPGGVTGECVCVRPCGREADATCGGICDFYPFEQCVEDEATGNCTCFLPCQAIGGFGQCQGECPPMTTCSFTGEPSTPCACF